MLFNSYEFIFLFLPLAVIAHFLAARVASRDVETFFVDDTYHVLTLDRRKHDVAARVTEFFLDRRMPDVLNPREVAHANDC